MKLVVVLSRFPYPLDKGDKLRAYYQIKDLSKSFDIYLCCIASEAVSESDKRALEPFCKEIHVFRIGKAQRMLKAGMALFSSQPIQVRMFYSRRIQQQLSKLIKRIQPDQLYCQLVRTAEYIKHQYSIPKTIDYMDALSTGMRRMSSESGFPMRQIYQLEAKRLVKYENLIFDYFDHHTIISDQDKALIYHPDRKKIAVIPNGVDLEKLQPKDVEKTHDLVFHGNMSYPPNVHSAIYIAEQILPACANLGLSPKAMLSGINPHNKVQALASEQVTVPGWVDDLRDAFCSAHIFVAPMLINTGLQNKILEAMSLGIPCISTSMANNAIGARPDHEIVIADTPEEFARAIQDLLDHPEKRSELAARAREFVKNRYAWEANNARLKELLLGETVTL